VLSMAISLLGIGKRLLSWLTECVRWLFKAWYRVAIAVLLMAGVYLFLSNVSLRKQVAHWKERYTVEATAHIKTRVEYTNAQKAAADMNRKQVERIENEYAAIAAKSERNYDALLADSRINLADWMRRSRAAQGSAGRAGTGESATVSGEPLQDAAKAEFLVRADDLEIAAENYAQLMALRDWALDVGKVE